MDAKTLTADLFSEYALLTAALDAAAPTAAVPSCPDWTAADLSWHVTEVYLHKVACIQTLEFPQSWPPERGSVPLAEAFAQLTGEFDTHQPTDPAKTFVDDDQTVGFWIRRMAQETVVHRIDAELTAGVPISPVRAELALDGIDELLQIFLAGASVAWPQEFTGVLATADRRPVRLLAGTRDDGSAGDDGGAWDVVAAADRIVVTPASDHVPPGATVTGPPEAVLRWVWNRGDDGVRVDGDAALIDQFKKLLVVATQ